MLRARTPIRPLLSCSVFIAIMALIVIPAFAGKIPPPPTDGTTYVVTTLDNVDAEDGFVSLIEAIYASDNNVAYNEAPAGSAIATDVITFDESLAVDDEIRIKPDYEAVFHDDLYIYSPAKLVIDEMESFSITVYPETELTVVNFEFFDCDSGFVEFDGLIENAGILNMYSCRFIGCDVENYVINNLGGIANIDSCRFSSCIAWQGAHVFNSQGTLNLESCTFYNSRKNTELGIVGCLGGDITINDCDFLGTGLFDSCDAVYLEACNAAIYDSEFKYNGQGAVDYEGVGGAVESRNSELYIEGCNIWWNYAIYNGGGIYLDNSNATIVDSAISNNDAAYGGGIFSINSNVNIRNSWIFGNIAYEGGGLFAAISNQNIIISNSVFAANEAFTFGAIYDSGNNTQITNCTVTANSAKKVGGIMGDWGTHVNNTICTFNEADEYPDIYRYCLRSSCIVGQDPGFTQIPDAGADGFWGTSDDLIDLSLTSDSIAIDAGDDALAIGINGSALQYDIDGNSRIVGACVDIGAYENQSQISGLRYPDFNSDGSVNIYDFLILRVNYGIESGAIFSQGDADGDGDVDIYDFLVLRANYIITP